MRRLLSEGGEGACLELAAGRAGRHGLFTGRHGHLWRRVCCCRL